MDALESGQSWLRKTTAYQRANRITVEAIKIARRDGRTPTERARIYEREVARLSDEAATVQQVEHISPAMNISGRAVTHG